MERLTAENMPKFSTPDEELAFLRAHIARREQEEGLKEGAPEKKDIASETLKSYKTIPQSAVLPKPAQVSTREAEGFTLRLAPESHDAKMEELLGILLSRGVKAALEMAAAFKNPHLDDDFHRFLVQYLVSVHKIPGLKDGTPVMKGLDMRLFEVTLPPSDNPEAASYKSQVGAMEQFYAGMLSIARGQLNDNRDYFTLEIGLSDNTDEVVVYSSVPSRFGDLFEKQILAFYQNAKVREITDDYNIFSPESVAVGSVAMLSDPEVFPIKTHESIDLDPMDSILNVFSKLKRQGEGAAFQLLIAPAGDTYIKRFNAVLKDVKDGMKVKDANESHKWGKAVFREMKGFWNASKKKDDEKKDIDDNAVSRITEKVKSTIVSASIRLVAAAETKDRAENILHEMESSFNQFTETNSNGFIFEHAKDPRAILHAFSYRIFPDDHILPLSLRELSTVFHFPSGVGNPQLKEAKAGVAPAPLDMGDDGILIGYNNYRGVNTAVHLKQEDRMRHFYVVGQTGTGKTGILKSMIAQDIANGEGCCFIDPHGTDIQDILSYIPPERADDVIYFDPAYTARPMGLNMLEFDPRFPEQKTMVIDTLLLIFNQLFDMKTAGGPMFEQYFKNSALLVMEHPESGNTLLEITRVLMDKSFREMKLSHCQNPIVAQFWKAAEASKGDQGLENFVPYISSKFDTFISNEFMRPVVLQPRSVLNFRDIMDNKKILLVNLSKGRLGELNANLIGMLVVMKFQMAALSRVDSYGAKLSDFFMYIDEFQNVTTPAIASILSEARKYRLSLNMAHQYIAQLDEQIKNAVFGNVGSMAVFRVSPEDANYLEQKFKPTFSAADITRLDNRNAYVSMIINGAPSPRPFNITTADLPKGNPEIVPKLKELSYLTYGRDRADVEAEIFGRYKQSQ